MKKIRKDIKEYEFSEMKNKRKKEERENDLEN